MTAYIVFWKRSGWKRAFQGDIHAASPREARVAFQAIWPSDQIIGVKREASGPWLA